MRRRRNLHRDLGLWLWRDYSIVGVIDVAWDRGRAMSAHQSNPCAGVPLFAAQTLQFGFHFGDAGFGRIGAIFSCVHTNFSRQAR